MKLINLQRYTPDELFLGDGILYFIDATGKDWYKSLPKFTKKYSLAIENDTGVKRLLYDCVNLTSRPHAMMPSHEDDHA